MRDLPRLPDSYFDRFKDKPVKLYSFDPKAKKIAADYIEKLRKLLSGFKAAFLHRGSTAFGIAGKRDIEIGVYPLNKDWDGVLEKLRGHYGKVDNLEKNYARFNDSVDDFEIEVILMRGREAEVDKKLTNYLLNHPKLLKEYEKLKYKYVYSKKEYMIQKDRFLRRVVEMVPEG